MIKSIDSNERLLNCIYPDGIPEPQSNCGNCLCCMNKQMSQFAFCFELNQSTQLNQTCSKWESEDN
jgi:hypothetical protein